MAEIQAEIKIESMAETQAEVKIESLDEIQTEVMNEPWTEQRTWELSDAKIRELSEVLFVVMVELAVVVLQ